MSIIKKVTSVFKNPKTTSEVIIQDAVDNNTITLDKDKPKIIMANTAIINLFTFNFTYEKFEKLVKLPKTDAEEWYDILYEKLPKYNINTLNRVSGFLAQTIQESSNFAILEENLYYSAAGLRKTFSKYFKTLSIAKSYAKQPKKIANKVYGGRLGNCKNNDDGWNYRGRGVIQCTGKSNYLECSKFLFKDDRLLNNPDLLKMDKEIAVLSACWYWTIRDINKYCDRKDIVGMTKAINGGTNGLYARTLNFHKALLILQ